MRSYRSVLEAIQLGELSVDEGLRELSQSAVEDIGFAQIDHDRTARRGFAEVVYCEGKTLNSPPSSWRGSRPEGRAMSLERARPGKSSNC